MIEGILLFLAQSGFICATADLPNGAVAGDAITVDGTT